MLIGGNMDTLITLDKLPIGHYGSIFETNGEGNIRLRLLDMGLIPGTTIKVEKTAPLGDPIQIKLRGYELTIRKDDASCILVKPGEKE